VIDPSHDGLDLARPRADKRFGKVDVPARGDGDRRELREMSLRGKSVIPLIERSQTAFQPASESFDAKMLWNP